MDVQAVLPNCTTSLPSLSLYENAHGLCDGHLTFSKYRAFILNVEGWEANHLNQTSLKLQLCGCDLQLSWGVSYYLPMWLSCARKNVQNAGMLDL